MSDPDAMPGGLRGWLRFAWPPLLAVIVGYVAVTVVALRPYDYNPTGPIRIGTMLPAARFWRPDTRVEPGVGYDGQWFFYIAHDPLLRAPDPESFLDLPAYRYARILYPTLAWMLALGQPAAIPWAMLAANLLAVLGGAIACLDLLRQLAASRWLVLAYAFSPPLMIGVSAMLAEPTSMALVAAGLALALRGRHRLAGVVLALAVLAREPSLLVPIGLGLYALGRLDWRRATAYLLPLAAPAAWHLWILIRLGSLPSAQSPGNFGVPFGGAYYRLGLLLGWHAPMLGEPVPSGNVAGEAMIVATSAAIIVVGLLKIVERRDAFAWLLWLQAALALGTGPLVWADLYSYGRVLGLLYFTFGLMVLTSSRRATRLPARLAEWTMPVPDATKSVRELLGAVTSPIVTSFSTVKRSEKLS
jgi:hypothetical protein